MVAVDQQTGIAELFELLNDVVDPEIPVLTLQDLGVIRDIAINEDEVTVSITPTYSGCPAMETMQADIEATLAEAGFRKVTVQQKLKPAWTTDWMSKKGREKLRNYGIAPPVRTACDQLVGNIECPQCTSQDVSLISEFGSTACKALYRCEACLEPFDYFKCI